MKVLLKLQAEADQTLPPMPVSVYTGSALPLELVGIPAKMAGGEVLGVSVTVTNADNQPLTGQCFKVGAEWYTLFAAAGFTNYGFVKQGVKFDVTVKRADGSTAVVTIGVADFEVKPASPNAVAGQPSQGYVVKGGDIYCKSKMVGGIQHFVKQSMSYDPKIGWGADWGGDYVLSADGQYVPYEEV